MEWTTTEWLGFSAAFFTTLAFLPQMIKTLRTASVDGLSLLMLSLQVSGNLLWVFYGFYKQSPSLVVANVITFSLVLTVLLQVIKHKSRQAP